MYLESPKLAAVPLILIYVISIPFLQHEPKFLLSDLYCEGSFWPELSIQQASSSSCLCQSWLVCLYGWLYLHDKNNNYDIASQVIQPTLDLTITTLGKKPFENIVREGENAVNQHFLHFPHCFQPYQRRKSSF